MASGEHVLLLHNEERYAISECKQHSDIGEDDDFNDAASDLMLPKSVTKKKPQRQQHHRQSHHKRNHTSTSVVAVRSSNLHELLDGKDRKDRKDRTKKK